MKNLLKSIEPLQTLAYILFFYVLTIIAFYLFGFISEDRMAKVAGYLSSLIVAAAGTLGAKTINGFIKPKSESLELKLKNEAIQTNQSNS